VAMTSVRAATAADVEAMAEALARSFHDDPVMTWLFTDDPDKKYTRLKGFMAREGRRHLRHHEVFTTDEHPGAAYWDPPGHWKTPVADIIKSTPFFLKAMGPRMPRALRGLSMIEKEHAKAEDHYYLAVLGTAPDHQGKGIGSALLQPVLERCDSEGVGAYLESSKEQNLAFYGRHGFEVIQELQLPGGPPLWPMWRAAR
jgi:ribosomal protein S18 acetylase RimI-like enzyme